MSAVFTSEESDAIGRAFGDLVYETEMSENLAANVEYAAMVLQKALQYAACVFEVHNNPDSSIDHSHDASVLEKVLSEIGVSPARCNLVLDSPRPVSATEIADMLVGAVRANAQGLSNVWFLDATLEARLHTACLDFPAFRTKAHAHLQKLGWVKTAHTDKDTVFIWHPYGEAYDVPYALADDVDELLTRYDMLIEAARVVKHEQNKLISEADASVSRQTYNSPRYKKLTKDLSDVLKQLYEAERQKNSLSDLVSII